MERYTSKIKDRGALVLEGGKGFWEVWKHDNGHDHTIVGDAIDRFAHYEELEEQGRMVVLPCKAGDELFRIVKPSGVYKPFIPILPDKVEPFGIYYKNIMGAYSYISFDELGKTVFLTREEAEAALGKEDK